MQDNNAYDNEYQNCFVTQGYGYNYEGAANVFTAQSEEQLKQISFKTLGAYDYTASVYALNADFDNPKDGRLLTAFSGKIENNGVHYIDVKDEVYLTSGEKFSVVIESNNDSSYMSFRVLYLQIRIAKKIIPIYLAITNGVMHIISLIFQGHMPL